MNSNLHFIQSVLPSLFDNVHIILAFNTFYLALKLSFLIFVILYVYKDSKKQGMDRILWVLIVLFVPNYLGFMTYLIVKTILNNSYSNERENIKSNNINY